MRKIGLQTGVRWQWFRPLRRRRRFSALRFYRLRVLAGLRVKRSMDAYLRFWC